MSKPRKPTGIVPCVTCKHPTREWKVPEDAAPGTRQRRSNGECKSCFEPRKVEARVTDEVDDARVAETRYQLGVYLRGREQRQARALRILA